MESMYKKKNLKFGGFHKEVKKAEIQSTREASRQKRLSTLRDICFNSSSDSKENINELGKKKTAIPSRIEMLKKWKEEKTMKHQKELKKSVMKPGFCLKKPASRAPDIKNITGDSKLNVRSLSHITQRSGSQSIKPAPTISKSATQLTKPSFVPKKPAAPVMKSTSTTIKSQVSQRSVVSKSILAPKSSVPKSGPTTLPLKTSALQGRAIAKETKPTFQKVTNPVNSLAQSSKVAAPLTTNRMVSKNISTLPKNTQKLPLAKSKLEKDIKNAFVQSINKPSRGAFPNRIKEPSSKILSKKVQTNKNLKICTEVKESKVKTEEIFNCDISKIEPSISRKSFAPSNFLFCPPSEWSFPFEIEIPSHAFLRLRSNGEQRTSSPIKLEESLKSARELSTKGNNGSIFNRSFHEKTSLEKETKSAPDDNEDQSNELLCFPKANAENLEGETDILEMRLKNKEIISSENCNISVSDFNLSQKLPQMTYDENVTKEIGKLPGEATKAKAKLMNVEHSPLVKLDNSASQFNAKECPDFCVNILNKNPEQDKFLEAVKCATFEVSENNKLINIGPIDMLSPCKQIENIAPENVSSVRWQIDNASQINTKDFPELHVPSSSTCETVNCASSKTFEENKLIEIEPIHNSSSDNNAGDYLGSINLLVPIDNNASQNNKEDCPYSCANISGQNPDQDKSLETVNPIIPGMLNDNIQIKYVDLMSSDREVENGLNGDLNKVEDNVDPCPISLSQSLKDPNLAASGVTEKATGKVSLRHRKSKMPPRYTLESINESLESKGTPHVTPKSVKKKLLVEENFTPRRSARLSEKLNKSGSFESLLNIEKPDMMNFLDLDNIQPKIGSPESVANKIIRTPLSCKKKSKVDEDFTPRRSQRLSEILRRSSSFESLFEVRRPSVMRSPCIGDVLLEKASLITYDFDNLALEDSPKEKGAKGRGFPTSKKVSLLYTPPARKSIVRQSLRKDLMSFSPS